MNDLNEEMINELRLIVENYLDEDNLEAAHAIIEDIIKNNYIIEADLIPSTKIGFASYYIEIASSKLLASTVKEIHFLVNKAFGIFSQFGNQAPELSLFINCNRASGNMTKADAVYIEKQKQLNNRVLTYEYNECIFDIKDFISSAIKNYWDALKICTDRQEIYNIKNNLSRLLSRAGRYVEALSLLEDNILALPDRWQSNASFGDCILNLLHSAHIPETPSLHIVVAERYYSALSRDIVQSEMPALQKKLTRQAILLKSHNLTLNQELIETNKNEILETYENHTEYRKFILSNGLYLNEHALYCQCLAHAAVDTLTIGTYHGSTHLGKAQVFPKLDAILNRTISEYCYSRLLYYQYLKETVNYPADVIFSTISGFDLTGYNIEALRTSYRLAYSILDKIATGVLVLFEIEKEGGTDSYFENVFDMNRASLEGISNVHLTALYSISSDLNKDYGSLRHYKIYRNELEHGFLAITSELDLNATKLTETELQEFTMALLKLTRSAIFSFTFLVRTETITSVT